MAINTTLDEMKRMEEKQLKLYLNWEKKKKWSNLVKGFYLQHMPHNVIIGHSLRNEKKKKCSKIYSFF